MNKCSKKTKIIDIKENQILGLDQDILSILLIDRTTEKNIIWATNDYANLGKKNKKNSQITIESIALNNDDIIKPRVKKNKDEQQRRIKDKGEVFTPAWVCNCQNNCIDTKWFGRKDIFNIELFQSWETVGQKVVFNEDKTWIDYLKDTRLEISCGEAPYLTSRYDVFTGKYIEVRNRIGLLDRKLRIISENVNDKNEWLEKAKTATKSIYGYDWQGDNILIARENILYTIIDYYEDKFNEYINNEILEELAIIISWNIWQMDGEKCVVPNSCFEITKRKSNLFEETIIEKYPCPGCQSGNLSEHNGTYCKIMDWENNKEVRYVDLIKGNK